MRYAKLQDEVLSTIMAQCRKHPPLDVAYAFHELKSFDALINIIVKAEEQGIPLYQAVNQRLIGR